MTEYDYAKILDDMVFEVARTIQEMCDRYSQHDTPSFVLTQTANVFNKKLHEQLVPVSRGMEWYKPSLRYAQHKERNLDRLG